jgi:flavin reductase (DIM6/NTAB) family NADH-FMN oxidoreductase RutF
MPAAGSAFAGRPWRDTGFGPVFAGVPGWAGCRVDAARAFGWGLLVEATIEHIEIDDDDPAPLIHYRGRYLAAGWPGR